MPPSLGWGQHDAGGRLGDIGGGGDRRLPSGPRKRRARRWRRRRTCQPHVALVVWKALTSSYFPLPGEYAGVDGRIVSGRTLSRRLVRVEQTPPSRPIGMRHDGCRRRGIPCHHDRAYSQRVQFRNQRRGIRPRRIAEGNHSGKFQRCGWTDGDGKNSEALRFKLVRGFCCIRLRWRKSGKPAAKRPLHCACRDAWPYQWQSPPTSSSQDRMERT